MATRKNLAKASSNLDPFLADIREAASAVANLKGERKSLNEDMKAIRERMEAKGISKKAFDMALRYSDWDPDDRKSFDIAYAIVRQAIGLPVNDQMDIEEYIAQHVAGDEDGEGGNDE